MRKPLSVTLSPEEISAIDPRWRDVVEQISTLQNRDLTYWEEFPLALPQTAFEAPPPEEMSGVFQAPTDDELDEVARGPDGNLRRLSGEQLQMLKEEGQLSVPSVRYPGQRHVWTLSAILQRGRTFIRGRLRRANAAALRELRFRASARLSGEQPISIRHAAKKFSSGLFHSVDLLLGLPQRRPRYSEQKRNEILQQERRAFVLQGLTQGVLPFTFAGDDGLTVDLAMQDEDLMEKAWPIIERLCANAQEEFKGQVIARREALLSSLREQGLPQRELASRLAAALSKEQRALLHRRLEESAELTAIYTRLPMLLSHHLRAAELIDEAEQALAATQAKIQEQTNERLCQEHPTLSLIPEWIERQLAILTEDETRRATEDCHQQIEDRMRDSGLRQEAFLFSRGIAFMREREPEIRARLNAQRSPARTFTWPRYIWRPQHWRISRQEPHTPEQEPTYHADKYQRPQVKTDAILWRPRNALWRTASFLNNGLHWLLVRNAWSGSLGLRALFGIKRFSPEMTVDPKSGALVPSEKRVLTFVSRLRAIHQDVRDSRRAFEEKPDTGIIGKSFSRWLNRAWNYVLKGFLGSLLVLVGQPLLTLLNLSVVLLLVLTSIAWAPLASLLVMAFNLALYDTEAPTRTRGFPIVQRLFQVAVPGLAQASLALVLAALFHPLAALVLASAGGLLALIRAGYDDVVRWLILKRLGRVPATSGFLARRVSGPGLSSEFYFQVRPELVLLLARARIERLELDIFHQKMQAQISAPQVELQRFTTQVFGAFAQHAQPTERVAALVNKTTERHTKALEEAVQQRVARLDKVARIEEAGRLRQTRQDLFTTLSRIRPMVQHFCEERLFSLLTPTERDAFFVERGLARQDFGGLSRWLLSSISPGLLEPLEEADRSLRLIVEPLNLSRYLGAVQEATPIGDDLDRVRSDEVWLSMPMFSEEPSLHTTELFSAHPETLRALLVLPTEKHRRPEI